VTPPSEDELRAIDLVVFDFDGVFTDNRVWVSETGEESVACWRGDGIGLRRLDEARVAYVIVSTEPNPVVARRAEKLRARCVHGVDDKLAVLREEAEVVPLARWVLERPGGRGCVRELCDALWLAAEGMTGHGAITTGKPSWPGSAPPRGR
jgi:3-deoxy-D-manno-octulosonate 8-phosphate phosphatase KdsC-like HAD superfamily phosphatase